jgi:hypothetical protein
MIRLLPLLFLVGCVTVPSVRSPYQITTEDPPATVDEAVAAQSPSVDDTSIAALPNQDPVGLVPGRPVPFAGILISEYDAGRYRLTDAAASRWRTETTIAQWRLARTERRDAAAMDVLERRIDRLATQAERRRRWMYIFLGAGFVTGVGATAGIVHAMR